MTIRKETAYAIQLASHASYTLSEDGYAIWRHTSLFWAEVPAQVDDHRPRWLRHPLESHTCRQDVRMQRAPKWSPSQLTPKADLDHQVTRWLSVIAVIFWQDIA